MKHLLVRERKIIEGLRWSKTPEPSNYHGQIHAKNMDGYYYFYKQLGLLRENGLSGIVQTLLERIQRRRFRSLVHSHTMPSANAACIRAS